MVIAIAAIDGVRSTFSRSGDLFSLFEVSLHCQSKSRMLFRWLIDKFLLVVIVSSSRPVYKVLLCNMKSVSFEDVVYEVPVKGSFGKLRRFLSDQILRVLMDLDWNFLVKRFAWTIKTSMLDGKFNAKFFLSILAQHIKFPLQDQVQFLAKFSLHF